MVPHDDPTRNGKVPSAILGADAVASAQPHRDDPVRYGDFRQLVFTEEDMLIPGFLPASVAGLLYGPPGSSKSFLAQALGVALASGTTFLETRLPRPYRTLYATLEHRGAQLQKRTNALQTLHCGDDAAALAALDEHFYLHFVESLGGHLHLVNQYARIARMVARWKIEVVLIDTLTRVTPGLDEKDNAAMGKVADALTRLNADYGVTTILLHHSTKAGGHAESIEAARGASALAGGVAVMFQMVPISPTQRKLIMTKSNHTALLGPWEFRVRPEDGVLLYRADLPTRIVGYLDSAAETGAEKTSSAVSDALGVPLRTVQREIAALKAAGVVHVEGEGKPERYGVAGGATLGTTKN